MRLRGIEAVFEKAKDLGIMSQLYPGQHGHVASICPLVTPGQIDARERWMRNQTSEGSATPASFQLRHQAAKDMSAIIGDGTPRLRAFRDFLQAREVEHAVAVSRGEIWRDEDWNRQGAQLPGPPDESRPPMTVESVHQELCEMTSQAICPGPVSC